MAACDTGTEPVSSRHGVGALPVFYGWVIVVLGALAMLATLPGRTHGLGMITERILKDPTLHFDRLQFGKINFWATILGAAFCLPCGRLLDRFGVRWMLTAVTAALGVVVLAMTRVSDFWMFFIAVTLTRGLGQSALSVVSLAMVGKWFSRRLSLAMGVYSILVALAFISAFSIAEDFKESSWRTVWSGMGWILLLGMTPLGLLLVRNSPEKCGLPVDGVLREADEPEATATGFTLAATLREPAFWVFALATSVYGLISSGISLFNESILLERGFDKAMYYHLLMVSTGIGLAGNFLGGWLVHWWSLRRVMALAMALLAAALLWLPHVGTYPELLLYAATYALAGGMVTVVFFTAFGKVFGRLHLGQIQGVAQMLTVFGSAAGPLLLAWARDSSHNHSYMPFYYAMAAVVIALGIWASFVKMPVQS